ncbi:DEAD/DEAH box helicase [Streptomyces harbinensis]|uniref:Helicase conserved C-terminal domain-containing protein n=1 Tax=Streptomyces harbinensis TaxID=1176198 RepID=A0A1I6TEY7_9ACTN|nr:DEAD/DEAH box helicase [Streptomyces harbinensis]QKV72124.1 DEAD/DEAH box helicase [Streptomyces harbinensis]SFS87725.1 Helicase conserved C-terminal domain-containing protein [Streptomyces harbinensis]
MELRELAQGVVADHTAAVARVREALVPLRDAEIAERLGGMGVERLKEVTEGRLRVAALEDGGYRTVGSVWAATVGELQLVPGVGALTAGQALAAARQIGQAVERTVTVWLDVDEPDARTTALVVALHRLLAAGPGLRRTVAAAREIEARLAELLPAARPARGRLRMLVAGREGRARARAAVAAIEELTADAERRGLTGEFRQASVDLLRDPPSDVEAWVDFELRSADYYSLLAELDARPPDADAAQGYVPAEIGDRVRAEVLDDSLLKVSLRGYQSFGARFLLAQRRVLLGDEMGLGKTVQAIAALAHLAARGETHFLVVCPASVLINWTREIRARSALRPLAAHGPGREEAFARWRRDGGVAVTTFDALRVAGKAAATAMLVVDEAHYVKNAGAQRTRAVAQWAAVAGRVAYLTGTPLENRVGEFRALVRQLRPEVLPRVDGRELVAGSQAFRRAVAPVYLRRNQEDVLSELPAVVRVDEWEEFGPQDAAAYREAVASGSFMAMRRAAYASPRSMKVRRIRELVAEAAESGAKVVIFSYFRSVLETVGEALDSGRVTGLLSGSTTVSARQRLVDAFTAADGHAVLLSQIQAGGVGLNLQAASVVILCEPQIKPTMEHQAVARAHRMGQVRTVRVHRLLVADSVDQRMLETLAGKSALFDAYARRSEVARATPDALDVSEGELARRIVDEERARLSTGGPPPA